MHYPCIELIGADDALALIVPEIEEGAIQATLVANEQVYVVANIAPTVRTLSTLMRVVDVDVYKCEGSDPVHVTNKNIYEVVEWML